MVVSVLGFQSGPWAQLFESQLTLIQTTMTRSKTIFHNGLTLMKTDGITSNSHSVTKLTYKDTSLLPLLHRIK